MMGAGLEPELVFYLEGVHCISIKRKKTVLYDPHRTEPEPVARACVFMLHDGTVQRRGLCPWAIE